MEFVIKKEGGKYFYYYENEKIPYDKIGSKMTEISSQSSSKETKRMWKILAFAVVITFFGWSVLSWWMIVILWCIAFAIIGGDKKTEIAFTFSNSADKKDFEKLINLFGEINNCAYKLKDDDSYVSYGIDDTFKIVPSVWYTKLDGTTNNNAFFMPGFLFFKDGVAIDYNDVDIANIDAYGFNYPLLNTVNEDQVILNSWRYTNNDGSKNQVRSNNHELQIIRASKLEFVVNYNGEKLKQYISFSNRELSKNIINQLRIVFPDINYRENLLGDRSNHQVLAFLFILVAGGVNAEVDDSEKTVIVNFVMNITKLDQEGAIKLVDDQFELYMEMIVASRGFGVNGIWAQEIVTLLNALKKVYNKDLCQEIYDTSKEIAFADGVVDEGEKIVLKSMKDILEASDAKGKSRVGAIEDMGKSDEISDDDKKSEF